MKKFIVTYHAPTDAMERMANVPPDMQAKGMQMWMDWAKRCGDKLVDLGSPLANGQELAFGGSAKKATSNTCGYSVLQAENMEEAMALLQGHPHIGEWSPEATIQVHETIKLPGM